MENPSEIEPNVASSRPIDNEGATPPPPPNEPSARGDDPMLGGSVVETGAPPIDLERVSGKEEEEKDKEGEEVVKHRDGSGVTPLVDSSAKGAGMVTGMDEEEAVVPPQGLKMGEGSVGGERDVRKVVGEGGEKETIAVGCDGSGLAGLGDQLVAIEVGSSQGRVARIGEGLPWVMRVVRVATKVMVLMVAGRWVRRKLGERALVVWGAVMVWERGGWREWRDREGRCHQFTRR